MAKFTPHDACSDKVLWHRFIDGDVQAWGTLLDNHYRTLFNYGNRFGLDKEAIHDCVHDLFLDFWDGRQRLNKQVENVSFYLLKSFRNKLLKVQHKAQLRQPMDGLTDNPTLCEESVEVWLTDQEMTQVNGTLLKRLLTSLPIRQQEVLYLKFYTNLTNKEVAETMNLQQQSVANLLHTALQRLRKMWGVGSGLLGLIVLSSCLANAFFV